MKEYFQRKLEATALLKATGAPIAADQLLETIFRLSSETLRLLYSHPSGKGIFLQVIRMDADFRNNGPVAD